MMSHFEIVNEEYIKEVKDKSKNENEYWKKVFKKWANERNFPVNLEEYEYEGDVLDQTLSQFYTFRNSVILASILLTSNHNSSW